MSPSSPKPVWPNPNWHDPFRRDPVRIALCPDRAALLRVGPGKSGRVRMVREAACAAVPDQARGENQVEAWRGNWHASLAALSRLLAENTARSSGARVVLSNHFVRYALVPLPPQLPNTAARDAYVRHHLRHVHGDLSADWALRWHDDGHTRLVCAIDQGLLDALEQICRDAGCPLRALRSWLMAAFNPWHRQLGRGRHWFALAEPERLVLGRLDGGRWLSLRSQRIGPDWRAELADLLERERFLAADLAPDDGLWLMAPGLHEALPGELMMQRLALPSPPGFPADAGGALAMARYG